MNLVWFRNDLRIADNPSLSQACNTKDNVIAVYCFDPRHYEKDIFGFQKTSNYRAQFLIESVYGLERNLSELNISLIIVYDKPEHTIPYLIEKYSIEAVYFQEEWTTEERSVSESVILASPDYIKFKCSYGQFLIHPDAIPFQDYQNIPEVFTVFRKTCEAKTKVNPVIPVPLPQPKNNLIKQRHKSLELSDLGLLSFEEDFRTAFPFKGGENQAIKRIEEYIWKKQKLSVYKKTRNGLIGSDYSSKLSAWLANGSISPRTIYWHVKDFEKEIIKNESTYWLIFELLWRDYFKYISLKHQNKIFCLKGISGRPYNWHSSETLLIEWIEGRTKSPFINANMKELSSTGWMSNRGRQNVASFWSKELEQDWRIGAAYFESMLIDYDVHSNWCNWMYTSGVGNDPRNRKFNIERQASIYDPQGKFQNLWLQETLF